MKHLLLLLSLILFSASALANDGVLLRDSDLKAEPDHQANTLSRLKKKTKLGILGRKGGWYNVKVQSTAQEGWVRMLSVRLGNFSRKQGSYGLSELTNLARTGSSGTSVATGIRGLTDVEIQNAEADMNEYKLFRSYGVKKDEAKNFAKEAGLVTVKVANLPKPKDK